MAYQKINNYPSLKTKGVYPSGSFKQLGLDNDELKKFSLGNWSSIMRGDVFFTYRETETEEVVADERGRPVLVGFDESRFEIGMSRIECKENDNGTYNNFGNVERPESGDFVVKMNTIGAVPNYEITFQHDSYDGYIDGEEIEDEAKTNRHLDFFKHYYSGNVSKDPTESEAESDSTPSNNDFNINVSFENTEYKSNRVMDFQDFKAFIVGSADGNIIKVKFYSNDDESNLISNPKGLIKKLSYTSFEMQDGVEDYFDDDSRNTEFYFPTFFYIKTPGSDTFNLGRLISFPEISYTQGYGHNNFVFDLTDTSVLENENFRLRLGFPNFEFNAQISSATPTVAEIVDFKVEVKTQEENELIYHDREENLAEYLATSYPVEVTLNMSLFDYQNFPNEVSNSDLSSLLSDLYYLPPDVNIADFLDDFSYGVEQSYFTYQVIQWGDESALLSDNDIKNTFFFNLYDLDEYPSDTNYFLRKSIASQARDAIPIQNQNTHVYNTPGVKSIKIIVYRYETTKSLLLQTYLINKNIVINDGILTSQDFSIFGGSNFTFLPITDNQAIIGGLDDESRYNKSVEKIVKNDNFIADDYLQRVSSKNYINKINNNFLGKRPGQLDLGQTRIFKGSKDIYDFIGGDKFEILNNGLHNNSLPVNSLASNIFIKDDKCTVDLNPSNTDYSVIQNQMGLKEIGILTGDYELNQPKDSKVQKQGVMETPLLDDNVNEQAF